MLYIINNEYYMLRNREYVLVNVELKDNELIIKPNRSKVIEANSDKSFNGVMIDDIIKKLQNKKHSEERLENIKHKKKQYNM